VTNDEKFLILRRNNFKNRIAYKTEFLTNKNYKIYMCSSNVTGKSFK
jgi:hypothetical protein